MKSQIFLFFALFVALAFAAVPVVVDSPADGAAGGSSGDGSGAKPNPDGGSGSNLPDLCSYVTTSACRLLDQACVVKDNKCTYKYQLPRPSLPKLPSAGSSGVPDLCEQIPISLCMFTGACRIKDGKCKMIVKIPGQD